jgi:hypothetical protein
MRRLKPWLLLSLFLSLPFSSASSAMDPFVTSALRYAQLSAHVVEMQSALTEMSLETMNPKSISPDQFAAAFQRLTQSLKHVVPIYEEVKKGAANIPAGKNRTLIENDLAVVNDQIKDTFERVIQFIQKAKICDHFISTRTRPITGDFFKLHEWFQSLR